MKIIPSKTSGMTLFILAVTGALTGAWLTRRNRQTTAPPTAWKNPLAEENQALRRQVAELQQQLDRQQRRRSAFPFDFEPVPPEMPEQAALPSIGRPKLPRLVPLIRYAPVLLLLAAAIVPPALVMVERWFLDPNIRDSLRHIWCQSPFLCSLWYPSFFFIAFISFGVVVLAFLIFVPVKAAGMRDPSADATSTYTATGDVRLISRLLGGLAAVIVLFAFIRMATAGELPGWEYGLAILLYLASRFLMDAAPQVWLAYLRRTAGRLLPVGVGLAALLFALYSLYSGGRLLILSLPLLLAALGWMFLRRRDFSPAWWLAFLALTLFSIRMGDWQFVVVGDDLSFFTFAREILHDHSTEYFNAHLFNGQGVYGTHPYFSSMIQAASLALLGEDGFGWRISSMFLAAVSLVFFHRFFQLFIHQRIALLATALLAVSSYLIGFSKIGYNNLQALFALGLVLWLAGEAVRRRSRLTYTLLGAAMGFCFYVYPAALYALPVPGLLLLVYDFPRSRAAWRRWLALLAALSLIVLPLLFQPGYWETKIPGTFLNRPEIVENGSITAHLGKNVIYAWFSFLYAPQESHYVVSSYVDPLTAVFVPLGFAWLLKFSRRHRFALFWLLSFLVMVFFVGATHDREVPSTTRMFLILPWFMLFAAAGIAWLAQTLAHLRTNPRLVTALLAFILLAIAALNIVQSSVILTLRIEGTPGLETLFVRLLQREDARGQQTGRTYAFITDPNWGISGIRILQDVSGLPSSDAQLVRFVVTDGKLDDRQLAQMTSVDMFIIIEPWMDAAWQQTLGEQLRSLGKQPCPVQPTPKTEPRFTFYYDLIWEDACPANGIW